MSCKKYPGIENMHHIPNGGKRGITQAARLKREGVLAGVSDNFLPVARRGYHGLYIEMKPKKIYRSAVSKKQKRFLQSVSEQDYMATVTYGADEAINLIKWYYESEV
jgi:hypothetical protein